ncbi:MAG: nucleotidyltransferase domain-containing protein [Chitinophagaceae bacterium]|nr:nucleotidyltransferase domain-containing protein [Chitinophagaceae bacterium]
MRFGLSDQLIERMQSVFMKHPEIESVLIYGSRAMGHYREGSDIDITLLGKALSEEIRSKVFWELDDLNTPYSFDLSIYHGLNSPDLEDHIQRVGKVFYTRKSLNVE